MRKSLLRATTLAGVLAATILFGMGSAAAVAPVQPNQVFVGSVNGAGGPVTLHPAVVRVFCPGAIFPGRKGHPEPNQPVLVTQVLPPVHVARLGFTGSAGTSIVATFSNDHSVPLTFTSYGVPQPIPATLELPCFGTGRVVFKPMPTSRTARSFFLPVRFVDLVP